MAAIIYLSAIAQLAVGFLVWRAAKSAFAESDAQVARIDAKLREMGL